jgi:hypothetical protein
LQVDYLPVKITRWPPGERKYGEASHDAAPEQVKRVS